MFSLSRPGCKIFIEASGRWGCDAVFGTQWMHLAWSSEWSQLDIMAKELVPIVLSCVVWGPLLLGSRVEFRCDNISVVESVSKGSLRKPTVMHLLHCLWFFSAYFDVKVAVSHIPGALNGAADALSRDRTR